MINPEFRKQVWIEMSTIRLIMMPLITVVILLLTYLSSANFDEFIELAHKWSIILIFLFIFFWGIRQVSESVIIEINRKTWYNQRMTNLTPFEIWFGKLFGSTIHTWYGAFFAFIAYIVIATYSKTFIEEIKLLVQIFLIGILSQSVTLLATFTGVRNDKHKIHHSSAIYFITGIIISAVLLFYAIKFHYLEETHLRWFIFKLRYSDFAIGSLVFFNFWVAIALHRSLRLEMNYQNGPFIWVVFLVSMMLYFSGFVNNIDALSLPETILLDLYISLVITILLSYILAFATPKHFLDYKHLLQYMHERQWRAFKLHLPVWFIGMVLSILLCIAIVTFTLVSSRVSFFEAFMTYRYPINLTLFLLRDLSILLLFHLAWQSKQADISTAIVLVILYFLIPSLISIMEIKSGLSFFLPHARRSFLTGTLPVLVQFLVALVFLIRRTYYLNKSVVE